MRTTIDIPDETYRELKVKAAIEGETLRRIILRGIQGEIKLANAEPARRLAGSIPQSFASGPLRIEEREQSSDVKKLETADLSSQAPQKPVELPAIRSARPGSLEIDNETADEIIGFP
jgi:hypothetical protein